MIKTTHIVFQAERDNRSGTVDIYIEDEDITFVPRCGDEKLVREALETIINANYETQEPISRN